MKRVIYRSVLLTLALALLVAGAFTAFLASKCFLMLACDTRTFIVLWITALLLVVLAIRMAITK